MDPIDIIHHEWSKSTKHDPNAYTLFKEYQQWENWHRELFVMAWSQQRMDNVLNENSTPAAKSLDEAVFKQPQIYKYDVLNKTIKTNYGKKKILS
jgi:hypothetical protein